MPTWIALLRGIGGGIRPMPMQTLVAALEGIGLDGVRTYIATGNVVFKSRKSAPQLTKQIEACIRETFGFESKTFVLSLDELARAAKANPFPAADANPKSLHLFFLARPAKSPRLDAMNEIKSASEAFVFKRQVFYFHTPQGFGISKLATRVEKLLGVETTARNWRTVTKLLAIGKDEIQIK